MHGLFNLTSDNSSRYSLHRFTTLFFVLTLLSASIFPIDHAYSAEQDRVPNIVLIFLDDK